jgi:hypothetical protein
VLRSDDAAIGSSDLLYAVSANGSNVITNALLVATGLTKTAILDAIGDRSKTEVKTANVRWSDAAQRVMIGAMEVADRYDTPRIHFAHILYALGVEAKQHPEEGVGQVIHQVAPYLNLDQLLRAIEELLDNANRKERVVILEEDIAQDLVALKLLDGQRLANRHQKGSKQHTAELEQRVAVAELALKIKRTVRNTLEYLLARS